MTFEKGILKIIGKYQGKLIAIKRLQPQCICLNSTSGEADTLCDYCLGTGRQILIQEIYGAVQDSNGTTTMRKASDYTITKELFIDAKYTLAPDDLVIISNQVWKVYQIKTQRLENNKPVYHMVYATPLKNNDDFIVAQLKKQGVIP